MITKDDAMQARSGQIFFHATARNRDKSALRARVTGRCITWKTRPDDFKLPVKHSMYNSFYITPTNAGEWLTDDPTMQEQEPQSGYDFQGGMHKGVL